jgi:plastocyanin
MRSAIAVRCVRAPPRAAGVADGCTRPTAITVSAGAHLAVANDDTTAHTATADDGSFDTGDISPGSTSTIDLSKPGRIAYHCSIHPFMHGTIVVR